jgi:hypothetical protein
VLAEYDPVRMGYLRHLEFSCWIDHTFGQEELVLLSVDYALGQAIEKDATRAIEAAGARLSGRANIQQERPTSRRLF